MKKILVFAIPVLLLTVFFTRCQKELSADGEDTTVATYPLALQFTNVAAGQSLALNSTEYTNALGEAYTISKFNYYISNIQLVKTDGSIYTVPQDSSYFLLKESDAASRSITLGQVPEGEYKSVAFTIGVDSARSAADLSRRPGVLDPGTGAIDMYWAWNSGYIFLKMEGNSIVSTLPGGLIQYHIGGFGGYNAPTINNIKKVSLNFPSGQTAIVAEGKLPRVDVFADATRLLSGTTNISIAANSMVMFDPISVDIANNYATMFTVNRVYN